MNPTVLLMVVPLLLVMVLPKMMDTNDPEFKEMQKMSLFGGGNTETPDVSDVRCLILLIPLTKPSTPARRRTLCA